MSEKLTHTELVPSHQDPVRLDGTVDAAKSIHGKLEFGMLTLRFWAQSIMQGLPEALLNMMGGLTPVSFDWSKDRPTSWFGVENSEITCRGK